MLAVVESSAILGVDAYGVRVEVNVTAAQLPQITIVGLPDAAVQESKERVRAAIKNSGLSFPGDKKITINLAPADLRKAGPAFDLPIAVGLLVATGQISEESLADTILVGELSLDGSVRPVSGLLPMAIWARQSGRRRLIVPAANTREAAIVGDIDVYPVHTLADVLILLADIDAATLARFWFSRSIPVLIFRTSKVRRTSSVPSKSRRRVGITLFWSGRLARVRPCWPAECRRSCPPSRSRRVWTLQGYTASAGCCRPGRRL